VGGVGHRHGRPARVPDLRAKPAGAKALGSFLADERGQDVVEYGLLIATIAIVVLIATTTFGGQVNAWFSTLAGHITTTGT